MNPVVVDTDIVSFLFKNDVRRSAVYRPHLARRTLVLSFMTVAELDYWALEHNWGPDRCRKMEEHLRSFVVYPYDRQLCRAWAEVIVESKRTGRLLAPGDAWVAAVAFLHQLPLVTHNAKHYEGLTSVTIITEPDNHLL